MNILIMLGLAKANDHFRKPWLFAAVYAAISLFFNMISSSADIGFELVFLSAGFSFVVAGLLLTLLLRFEDSILMCLVIFVAGIFVLSGGSVLLFSE